MRRRHSFTLLVAGALLLLGACDDGTPPPRATASPEESATGEAPRAGNAERRRAFDPRAVGIELRPFVAGLSAPLYLTPAGDGSDRLFVLEQGGVIRIIENAELRAEPFLDLSDLTEPGGERGLLGLAFHPDYASNGRFFVNYTDNAGDTVIAEYRRASPERADPDSARVLLTIDQPFSNHNGGHLAFGPDGYLYIGTGDGGSAGDPNQNAQSLQTLLGKLLRIDVDAARADRTYGVPSDNPFVDRAGARPEIWAYGLRNPWRFSFDIRTDRLWIGDVGQDALEEIDRTPVQEGGLNYGWDIMEGSACFEPSSGCDRKGLVLPLTEYGHEDGCSVTGGYVYRGRAFKALRGGYFFADFCSGKIWALSAAAASRQKPVMLLDTEHSISSFGMDARGELYVVDLVSGEILRLTGSAAD